MWIATRMRLLGQRILQRRIKLPTILQWPRDSLSSLRDSFALLKALLRCWLHLISKFSTYDDEKDLCTSSYRLSVPLLADVAMLKKGYWELILHIHLDKNRSVGADEDAFKMVQKVCAMLFDKQIRATFDQKLISHRTSASLCAARESDNNIAANNAAVSTEGSTKPKTESTEFAVP